MAEASEGMLAGVAFINDTKINAASNDSNKLQALLNEVIANVEGNNVEGIGNVKNDFLKTMKLDGGNTDKVYTDLLVGMSAMKAVRQYLRTNAYDRITAASPTKVFLTGTRWPTEVQKFKINAFGMADYNSSDVIFRYGTDHYVGISLKKKPKSTAADPTIINKAFDTLMQGATFNNAKKELLEHRQEFFADVIREAKDDGPLKLIGKIEGVDNWNTASNKQLWDAKVPRRKNNKTQYEFLINIKDVSSISDDPSLVNSDSKAHNAMRDYVNKKLQSVGNTLNPLYQGFLNIMDDHADLFAESLINLVLKSRLQDTLENLAQNKFEFVLVTGIGECKRGSISMGSGEAIGLDSVQCVLAALAKQKAHIKLDTDSTFNKDAAKVFFDVYKGDFKLLSIELRYKGDFHSQPQFFATISSELKSLLKGQFSTIRNIIN